MRLGKHVTQLEILSKLRNLQELTIKNIEAMPLVYDLKTDVRYKQGIEQGIEIKTKKMILKAFKEFPLWTDARIATFVEVPVKVVKQIRKELKEKREKTDET